MARITENGIAKEAMRRRLPKGFSETPYRKYFFDCASSDCDRVLSIMFNKGKQFGGDPKLRICVIFDDNTSNVSDELRIIISNVLAIGETEIWFAKHNKEWMYSVGIGKKYGIMHFRLANSKKCCIFAVSKTNDTAMTYFEFANQFPDETSAINFIVSTKYKDGYVCPKCGCVHKRIYHQHYDPRKLYCKNCNSEFSALVGTIFENTHLDMRMWLYAINLCMVARKGISALQLQRELGMGSYHSAWRMLHLIRQAMGKEEYKDTFEAIVEIDETYVGGKPRKENKHSDSDNYKRNKRGRGTNKTPVVGVTERNTGKIHAVVAFPNKEEKKLSGKQLLSVLDKVCKKGTTVMTDQLNSYGILDGKTENEYVHIKIDHSMTYSLGDGQHTNSIESCWAILKRSVYGIFHHVSVKYLQQYVDEFCFRLNHRDCNDAFLKCVQLSVA